MTIKDLQARIGVTPDGQFGPVSKAALLAKLANPNAPALTDGDIQRVAGGLGVSAGVIRAVRKVEAPRGAFDSAGRPSILYEKHIFGKETGYRWNAAHPVLSSTSWQPGTYGPFSGQYTKLANACALDPDAAFKACSWGAFQVLGQNAIAMGYPSAIDMAFALTESEAAHLECFARFVRMRGLEDELRACRPGDPKSCVPFVRVYNGPGYAANDYHTKLSGAIA
jgi:hypothetical protein